MIKRLFDTLVAALAGLLLAPLMAVIAICVRRDSAGPAIFRQERIGRGGEPSTLLKFRSMASGPVSAGPRVTAATDSRITKIGARLRDTKLDELPQLINVVRGDMSIVGPRPHALIHDEKFSSMLEDYANRHQVKPGITGLAQVNGLRGETRTHDSIRERVDHDMAYIRAWSLSLDLKIIARTLFVVFTGKNAH